MRERIASQGKSMSKCAQKGAVKRACGTMRDKEDNTDGRHQRCRRVQR